MSQPDYSNMRKLVTGDIVIKCRYGKDIRRLTINQAPTYDELCLMVSRIFKLPSSEDLTLKYTDNENDLISLLDDNDISHAVSLSTLLKITIFDKNSNDADALVPGILPDELKLQLTTLRDSLDTILRFVPENKADHSAQPADVKYKPLSTAELASFLDVSTGSRPSLTPKASTDALSNETKQTPTMKNAMYFPPPGTPKQMPMKSPALQQMHPPVPYGQRASPLNYPNYGPAQVSPSAPGTPHSGGAAAPYQPNNNKLAGPYMNARPPPPNMQQPQRQQNGYPAPGTPLAQHQFPPQQSQQRPPPPPPQQQQSTPPQQQQQQPPPATTGQAPPTSQGPPPVQQQQPVTQAQGPPPVAQQQQPPQQPQGPPQNQSSAPAMPPAGFNPPATQQQAPPQPQAPPQQQNYYYQPPNGQQPPQTPQQNFRPPPNPNNRW